MQGYPASSASVYSDVNVFVAVEQSGLFPCSIALEPHYNTTHACQDLRLTRGLYSQGNKPDASGSTVKKWGDTPPEAECPIVFSAASKSVLQYQPRLAVIQPAQVLSLPLHQGQQAEAQMAEAAQQAPIHAAAAEELARACSAIKKGIPGAGGGG
ncbi:hypothetical protein COCOBI_13-3690 [Coccomyxa sp. Obi]|nr:hypothetical protein COCOBI_13-3690 [Coccomyxa sp. Obi]